MGWSGGLYKRYKVEFMELFVGLFGVFVGEIWYYMGLYLYKSG